MPEKSPIMMEISSTMARFLLAKKECEVFRLFPDGGECLVEDANDIINSSSDTIFGRVIMVEVN
jgi:hypothetical protein